MAMPQPDARLPVQVHRQRPIRRLAAGLAASVLVAVLLWSGASRAADAAATGSRIDPCQITGVSRVVAVGDVHGAYDAFVSILQASGILDDRVRWSGGTAHLVQMGDLIDRGPQARQALDLVMRLEQEAERAGGRLHVLLGNHEVAVMLGDWRASAPAEFEEFRTPDSASVRDRAIAAAIVAARREAAQRSSPFDDAKLRDELAAQMPLGWIERRAAFGPDGKYGRWLRERPAMVRINGVAFVHGGISPEVAPLGCDAINARVRADLTNNFSQTVSAPLESLVARPDGPLWYRGLAQLPDPAFASQVETILARLDARAIVAGHSVVAGGRVTARFGGRVYLIDTGMLSSVYQGGRPSAIEFADDGVTAIYLDGRARPVERGPGQAGSPPS